MGRIYSPSSLVPFPSTFRQTFTSPITTYKEKMESTKLSIPSLSI